MERVIERRRGPGKGGEGQGKMRAIGMWGRPGKGKGDQGRVVGPLRGGEGHGNGGEGQGKVERARENLKVPRRVGEVKKC